MVKRKQTEDDSPSKAPRLMPYEIHQVQHRIARRYGFEERTLRLEGELVSAGIFPKIKEPLKIMADYLFYPEEMDNLSQAIMTGGGYDIFYDEEKRYLSFTVGSAITALCNAEDEYEECLLKAKAMFEVLK